MSYNGWMLPDTERARVLGLFAPRFAVVKATHVTLSLDVDEIPCDAKIEIVGYATDHTGLEALVCCVNDEMHRPDGGTFHLTLSVAEGRASKESNSVIITHGFTYLDNPVPLTTRAFLSRGTSYVTTPLSA